ncbi:MAG: phosphoribosylglycinamide formyltransferase [Candidatus Cloacimonadota bacterium]|nr:phosphoribosylglycinamide formyltransferase [Candidatus Cloacimonadota bacterium]
MKKIVILISGRGSNMIAIARNIQSGILKDICIIQSVFSNKDNIAGLQKATEFNIPTFEIDSKGKKRRTYNAQLLEWLKQQNPDFIVLAGYMKILSSEIIREFPQRIINIHPADTSLHQGLHGYDWAFNNKLKTTKVTVHYVDEGLDTGKVIGKKDVDISDCKTIEEVEQKGLKVEHEFYSECLFKILTGKIAKTQKKQKN